MPLVEDLPTSLETLLNRESLPGANGEARMRVATDLDENGNYHERWLTVAEDRVLVMDPDHGNPHVAMNVPLADITEVKTSPLVGAGILEATVNGEPVE